MSIDYHAHLGPYALCDPGEKPAPSQGKSCLNRSCPAFGESAVDAAVICSLCGMRVGAGASAGTVPGVDHWAVRQRLKNALRCWGEAPEDGSEHDLHAWMPNVYRNPPRELSFDPRRQGVQWAVGEGDMALELGWFASAFGSELDALAREYGPANVRLCWGLLCWQS